MRTSESKKLSSEAKYLDKHEIGDSLGNRKPSHTLTIHKTLDGLLPNRRSDANRAEVT
jgi:hypothetical protein